MTAEHDCGAEIPRATATARRAVSAALLAALETARWPDGSRLVDVSDQTIQQRLVPALTDELIAQFSRVRDVDTGAAT